MINKIEGSSEDYVIIGNGAAGYYAASSIRKNNAFANIKIISDEKVFTYYRPMLSSYLSQDLSDKRFYLNS